MASRLSALRFDALAPERLARFWSGLLGGETTADATLLPGDDVGFAIRFVPSGQPKTGLNQIHFDLSSNLSPQQETVDRAVALGARHFDVGQKPEEDHVVLADPEGNEFCVIPAGNRFLAGCPPIGALSCDGTQAVGYFWSRALDWPLVWDENEETAIRSPRGGPKISWGGPPLNERTGRNRLRFELVPDGDRQAEINRLITLGATLIGTDEDSTRLADPDGNEFHLRSHQ
ncbi:VOC family protein [Actinoplanes missouriensis]|uniref:VOC family protein n=1 Tax=Actinoplanes missouriensis TaxID=1866 RepID=UPI0033D201D1